MDNKVDFEQAYLNCVTTFNNIAMKITEEIEAETEAYLKGRPGERGQHLAQRTIGVGKLMMIDQVLCYMFHELGMEVEKDDYKKRFGDI